MADPIIYFVRHGQTDWNAELRFQGRQDIPLNDTGRQQARAIGARLKELFDGSPPERLVCSPLGRARETMRILCAELGEPDRDFTIDERLIEASYGELEGTTLPQFKSADPAKHRWRKNNRWIYRPPGGESHAMVAERMREWLDEIKQDVLVVAHGVVGRVLRQRLLGIDPDEAAAFTFPQDRAMIWQGGTEKQV